MKIKSNIELNYSAGREGVKKGIIELAISTYKNTDTKVVNLNIVDKVIIDSTTDNKIYLSQSTNSYIYEDYDELLLSIKEKGTYEQTGSALEDELLHDFLLQEASKNGWYDSVSENWEKV